MSYFKIIQEPVGRCEYFKGECIHIRTQLWSSFFPFFFVKQNIAAAQNNNVVRE